MLGLCGDRRFAGGRDVTLTRCRPLMYLPGQYLRSRLFQSISGRESTLAFEPLKPAVHHAPLKVADDTWLIQQVQEAAIGPLFVYLNSLVIKGPETIIVDTGTPANRDQWMKDVFSLVDPGAVRWIFLSHADVDHAGNLAQVMEACPNATLVVTWFLTERHACDFNFPFDDRMRWVNDGDVWRAGDRTLTATTAPLFYSPVPRG